MTKSKKTKRYRKENSIENALYMGMAQTVEDYLLTGQACVSEIQQLSMRLIEILCCRKCLEKSVKECWKI